MELKRCSKTGMMFPLTFFGKSEAKPDGLATHSYVGALWINISQRAVNGRYASNRAHHYPNNSHHRRGIRICEEWRDDPTAFAWYVLTTLGYPSRTWGEDARLSIDRINNDGDYEPGNLRWATAKEQMSNTSLGAGTLHHG